MEKFTNEELLEVLPSNVKESIELTTKQKVILGQLYMYNGLEIAKKDGYFYRSNKDLCNDCGISEHTLIVAVRKLEALGFIERKKGARNSGASEYRINCKLMNDYCKTNTANCSEDYSKQILELSSRIKELENTVKLLMGRITVIESRNYSTETDTESDIEKEKDIESINNIIKEKLKDEKLYEQVSTNRLTESQLVQAESATLEQIMQSSTDDEDATCSSEEEQYQQWLQLLEPYIDDVNEAKTIVQLNDIKSRMEQVASNYLDQHNTSSTVMEKVEQYVLLLLNTKLRSLRGNLQPSEMDVAEYIRQRNASA